jgi:hypothetical protein
MFYAGEQDRKIAAMQVGEPGLVSAFFCERALRKNQVNSFCYGFRTQRDGWREWLCILCWEGEVAGSTPAPFPFGFSFFCS